MHALIRRPVAVGTLVWRVLAAAIALGAGVPVICQAQSRDVRHVVVACPLDSGAVDNPAAQERVVFDQVVQIPGAPWLRLAFDAVTLADKSYLRITSFEDGQVQTLDRAALAQWQNTTAYFNGSGVLVELVAAPNTRNAVAMTRILAGAEPGGVVNRRVCDSIDDRVPAVEARVGRLLALQLPLPNCPNGLPCTTTGAGLCTGELIDVAPDDNANDRLAVSAGHCFGATGTPTPGETSAPCVVMQFGPIPNTDTVTCGYRHPPVAKQFVVNNQRARFNNPGSCGNDWAVFTLCPNPSTGRTAFQEQGAAYTLAPAAPANGAAVTKYGYGVDGPLSARFCDCVPGDPASARSGTLQSASGTVTAPVGADFGVVHNAHTCGGDSGCALIDAMGRLTAIHTQGFCDVNPAPPTNCGTSVRNANLQAAIALIKANTRPVNDDCTNATVVLLGQTPYVTKNATTDGPTDYRFNFDADQQARNDIWFRFTSPVNFGLPVTVSLCNSDFDTRLAIYHLGCPSGPDSALAVADDSPGCATRSELTFTAQAFATYLIRVGSYGNITGSGTLSLAPALAPGNNVCGAMTLRRAIIGENPFDNTAATTDGPAEAACAGGQINRDVWWRFIPCQTGRVRIETCGATPFDTCLAVYAFDGAMAPCPRGALIAADDNACGRQSRVEIDVEVNVSYLIRVGSSGQAHGAGVLTINPIQPINDGCADAVTVFEGRHLFDNRGATTDGPVASCTGFCENDVWFYYIYTGAAAANIAFETCDAATDFDTVMAVYAGAQCPPMAAETACNDDSCGRASRVVVNANPGDDFVIRVGSFTASRTGCGALKITAGTGNAPTNDDACNFTVLYDGTTPYSTVNATTDGVNPLGDCLVVVGANGNRDMVRDIWYRYPVGIPGNIVVDACDADFDTRLAAYSSRYPGGMLECPPREAERVACGDDDCGDPMNPVAPLMNVPIAIDAAGETNTDFFWIRVGGYRPTGDPDVSGMGTLNVRQLLNDNPTAARFNFFRPGVLVGNGNNTFNNRGARPFAPNPASNVPDGPALGAACDPMAMIRSDLWFFYTATTTGNATFRVTAPFDSVVAVYDAPLICVAAAEVSLPRPPGAGDAPLACDHTNMVDGANKVSTVTRAVVAGNRYWVRVGGFGDGQSGMGTLRITPTAPVGPENNDCLNARTAELGDNVFTTVGATTDGPALPPAAACTPDNQIHQDVWFTFTPNMPGNLVAETCGGPAAFDTRLAIYTPPVRPECPPPVGPPVAIVENCPGLTLVANGCNDNSPDAACAPRSSLNIPVTAGTTYYIRIGGVDTMTGSGTLTLRFIMNDVCVRAKPILTAGGAYPYVATSVAFNNRGANTDGAADAACNFFAENQIGQDLWYLFSSPQKGRLTIDTIGSQFDTKLAIYDGGGVIPPACPPGAPLACNDDIGGGNLQSRVERDVMGGDIILVRVGGFRANQGAGLLNVRFVDHDSCDRPRTVTEGLWGFDTRGASPDGMASCGASNMTPDVWFLYTAGCDGDVIADTCSSSYDTVLTMYNDDCMMLMEKACNDDDFGAHCAGIRQSYLSAAVTMGQRYLIRVSGFNTAAGFGQLSLRCEPMGACCIGATCQLLRGSECTEAGRQFHGPDTVCNPPGELVTPCCRADFNHNGMVSVQDIFDYLVAYFSNDIGADTDDSMVVELQDLFDFLAAYFAGCA